MINIMYAVDPIKRIVKPMSGHAVTEQDHEASSLRFAFPDNIAGTGLDSTGTAVRVMYIRPDGDDPVAKTLTFYKHSGGYYLYDWSLQKNDLQKEGRLVFSLCILNIAEGEVSEWHTTPCAVRVLSTIHTDDSDEGDDTITPTVKERVAVLETMIQRVASGAPIVVSSTSEMTDTEQIYVLSTNGRWYYHNGTTWVSGGTYGAVSTDTTLTQAGMPADAKKVGDKTNKLALNSVQMSAGDATNIPENADLNDYILTASGGIITAYGQHNYKVQTTTIAQTISNMPAPVAGALKVMELAGGSYVLQLFMTVREQNIYVRYAVNSTFTDWVYIATENDIESLQAEIDSNTSALQGKTDITSLFLHGSPFYSHCFLDATASETAANENVIPSKSIHDIEFARRVGFKVIEANTQETADGQYVVIHGIDNNWGYEVYDLAGSDISNTAINTCTMDWIREHVRYRSKYAKYRTVPLELTEWLKACRMNNLIPLVRIRKSEDIDLVNNIMGKNNYIAYNASRSDTDGCLMIYVGSGVTTYEQFVERFVGTIPPAIIALGNWNSWSVDDVKKAVKWAHDRGLLISAPGNYMTQAAIQKYYMLGFDVFASTSNIPPITYGNLLNISSDEGYSSADFSTTGTVSTDGVMVLNKDQYVELATSKKQSQYIAGATLFIRFSGSPIITMGSKFMPAFGVTSAENRELQVSTFYVEEAPSFRLKNNEDTPLEIYSLDFRASRL